MRPKNDRTGISGDDIRFYNHSRFQEKRNGFSPVEYREKAAA
ncbi:IS3 family transposase [Saccharococcus caldoxylosilyticus]